MKMLGSAALARSAAMISENGRELERLRLDLFLADDGRRSQSQKALVKCLANYQNDDGGFGHGFESDFLLPASSAMATSIALRLLVSPELRRLQPQVLPLVTGAIGYLERTFDQERRGWWAVPSAVNQYPHAPWWHYDSASGMTVIDQHWGNPTAELLGYLHRYRQLTTLPVDDLIEYAIERIQQRSQYESEHEVYCYIQLYRQLLPEQRQGLLEPLRAAVQSLVCSDPEQWSFYVPKPLDFSDCPQLALRLGLTPDQLSTNLDYLATLLCDQGGLWPVWNWNNEYTQAWERARREWAGQLTLAALIALRRHGRITS